MMSKNVKKISQISFILNILEKKNVDEMDHMVFQYLNEKTILKKASQNRVLYLFSKSLLEKEGIQKCPNLVSRLKEIKREGELRVLRLRDTLKFINSLFSEKGILYRVVKTYKNIPFITFDVDLLVSASSFPKVKRTLRDAGIVITSHSSLGGRKPGQQINCIKKGIINVDIHSEFSWQRSDYLDQDLFWNGYREITSGKLKYKVPSLEVDFLVNLAEAIYERFYVTLLLFLYVRNSCKKRMDWSLIFEQVRKHKWDEAFAKAILVMNELNNNFYPEEEKDTLLEAEILEKVRSLVPKYRIRKSRDLPYLFPVPFVLGIFWEKWYRRKEFDPICFAYYWYMLIRYHFTGKKRFPLYLDWYPLDRFHWKDASRFE